MDRYPLYTYKNLDEFNLLYQDLEKKNKEIHRFRFQETRDLLEENSNETIEISSLVEYLRINPSDIFSASHNFAFMDENDRIIVREDVGIVALEIFREIFDSLIPLNMLLIDETNEICNKKITSFTRKILYSYKNGFEFEKVIDYLNSNEIPFINFSILDSKLNDEINDYTNKTGEDIFIDITSIVLAVENNPSLIYVAEQYLSKVQNFKAIIREQQIEKALDYFNLIFHKVKNAIELFPDLGIHDEDCRNREIDVRVRKITDFNHEEINHFLDQVSSQLIGHEIFKERFSKSIRNFVLLNKIKKKRVFSLFLLGPSGIGKTEFARIIKDNLNPGTTFTKINFGNFSSKDSLNSLIGSPKGYIGSEDGELSHKVTKSKAGIILCDEFEKAAFPIFNFFLELLEDGYFTDSVSREYDLDGYIIVFTSNLDEQMFYKTIPSEMRSRLDLICEFEPLTPVEKRKYVSHYVEKFFSELSGTIDLTEVTSEEILKFKTIDVDSLDNLRDINRRVNDQILEKLEKIL